MDTQGLWSELEGSCENLNQMSIVNLSKESNWLILYNAHLYGYGIYENDNSLHYFFHDIMKNLLKYIINQHVFRIHSDFKIFIVLEKMKSFQYAGKK